MATLTLNAAITPSRQVAVTYSTSGSLSGKVALLVDNTIGDLDADKLINGILRSWRRQKSKVSKVSSIATSGTTKE